MLSYFQTYHTSPHPPLPFQINLIFFGLGRELNVV